MTNRMPPALSGVQIESANYQVMGFGLTDRIFLLGHGNLSLNDPYQVIDIQTAIDDLGANVNSPLLRGTLEAYYAGSRDIYLVTVAPMVEFVSDWSSRTTLLASTRSAAMLVTDPTWKAPPGYTNVQWDALNFFQRYAIRLQNAYIALKDWDLPQLVVPLDAPYYSAGAIDFRAPLAQFCADHFENTGAVCIGIMGSQMTNIVPVGSALQTGWTTDIITKVKASTNEVKLGLLGDGGKFVSVFLGEGTFNFKQFPVTYTASLVSVIAGLLSTQPLNQGVMWKQLPNVVTLTGPNMSQIDINSICELGLNPIVRTSIGKRGNFFEVVAASDNTCAVNGSDFWSLVQVRLIMKVIEDLQTIGRRYLGSIGYGQAKIDMQQYFLNMVTQGIIRSFQLNISKQASIFNGIIDTMAVDVSLQPFFGLRQINFIALVGPGA